MTWKKKPMVCSWRPFWCGLLKSHEYLFSVDQFSMWRRHQVWAHRDGAELRAVVSQRFSSNNVFLSLLISTEVGILFSPSEPADEIRHHLEKAQLDTWGFWAGFVLCFAIFISICALYTSFIAWGITANIGPENVHATLRSSIGLYATQLPNRLIVLSIYLFFLTFLLLLGILIPHAGSVVIASVFLFLMVHINSTYSAMGHIIMDTGAMGDAIFLHKEEERMSPDELFNALLEKVHASRKAKIPVHRVYRMDYRKSLYHVEMGGDVDDLPLGGINQSFVEDQDVDMEEGKEQEKEL